MVFCMHAYFHLWAISKFRAGLAHRRHSVGDQQTKLCAWHTLKSPLKHLLGIDSSCFLGCQARVQPQLQGAVKPCILWHPRNWQCLLHACSTISSCSVTKLCPTLCDPMDCSIPGFPVLHYLSVCSNSSIESVMPSNYLIFCHLPLLLPTIFPSIKVFSNESALRIRWPKY